MEVLPGGCWTLVQLVVVASAEDQSQTTRGVQAGPEGGVVVI